VLQQAFEWAGEAQVLLAMGSSLVVQPAAMIPVHAHQGGAFLAIINRDPTPCDDMADVVIRQPIGETLMAINEVIS